MTVHSLLSATEKPAEAKSRTDRFMARVVEHIATLEPADRAPWLRRQLAVWIRQYERWALFIDGGQAHPISDVTAEDYLATISALDRMLHAEATPS